MLTVSQQPQIITPAYNDQYIVALSDETANSDFYYQVNVNIGGDDYNYKIYPNPEGYMLFNPKDLVKNYIQREVDFNSLDAQTVTNKSVIVTVYILEYYDGTTTGHDSTQFTYYAFDACLKEADFLNWDYLTVLNGTSTSLLSSNNSEATYPDSRVQTTQDVWIHFYNNSANNIYLEVYNSSNVLQGNINLPITMSPVNPVAINAVNIGANLFINQSPSIVPQSGWYVNYEIQDTLLSSTMFVGTYTFNDICSKYGVYTVYYLKRNGNIGYYHFEQKSFEKISKKTNTVRLNPKRIVGGVYTSNTWDRELSTVSTDIEKSITLNTNWMSETVNAALDELFDSPIVWINNGNGYKPVTITNTEYEYKKHKNENLIQLTIDCKYSQTETRQRGL